MPPGEAWGAGIHLRELAYLVTAPFGSLIGLVAFETWWSAALYAIAVGLIAALAVRRQEKHHRPEVYDDRLSAERMAAARDWLVEDRASFSID